MILGVLVGHKSYPMKKYLFVLLIVIGVVLFMYKDRPVSSQADSSFGLGEILLLLSLTMDGLTGAVQVNSYTYVLILCNQLSYNYSCL